MIYLSTPYSHPSEVVREHRYRQSVWAASILARQGIPCYSAIAAWHIVAKEYNMPGDAKFWWQQDEAMMEISDECWLIMFPGYEESDGMLREAEYFIKHDKLAVFIPPGCLMGDCQRYLERRTQRADHCKV